MQATGSLRLQQPPKNWPVDLFLHRNVWYFFFFRKTQQDFPAIFFAELPKKESATEQPIKKKHPKKKSTESTHHSPPPRFSQPWAVPCDKFVKLSTEKFLWEVDGWTCIYSQPRKSIRKTLKAPVKMLKTENKDESKWKTQGKKTLHFPIDSIDFSWKASNYHSDPKSFAAMRSALPSPYWSRRCLFSNLQINMNTYRILSVACSLINHQKLFAISRYFRAFFIYQPKNTHFAPVI